ncbi:hypothetical protein ACG04R_18950 [Roseateles sp. BYS78W]|uniref:Uncharacterized protein n=1 Tax=Pelomonas candidula TaxID=3299025 RepID=A0ABW7HFT6_9BURK
MSKHRTANVSFFCLPEELSKALENILSELNLKLFFAVENGGLFNFQEAPLWDGSQNGRPIFYALPADVDNNYSRKSLMGIVQIWFPVVDDKLLRMGNLAFSSINEPSDDLQFKLFSKVKHFFKKNFLAGVVGINSNLGREHIYRDIYVSHLAQIEANKGKKLFPKLEGGYVSFRPL